MKSQLVCGIPICGVYICVCCSKPFHAILVAAALRSCRQEHQMSEYHYSITSNSLWLFRVEAATRADGEFDLPVSNALTLLEGEMGGGPGGGLRV